MAVRRRIWDEHKAKGVHTQAIIDPRMGGEAALLYVMNPMDGEDIRAYEKTLYSDAEAMPERCTAKATIYCANLLAGLVVKSVKDILTGNPYTRIAQWDIAANQLVSFPPSGAGSKTA